MTNHNGGGREKTKIKRGPWEEKECIHSGKERNMADAEQKRWKAGELESGR